MLKPAIDSLAAARSAANSSSAEETKTRSR